MKKKHTRPPLEWIISAQNGNQEALQRILRFYESLIRRESTIFGLDSYGNSQSFIHDGLQKQLESKLIALVIQFRIL